MTSLRPFKTAPLPDPPPFLKILGPSFIILGLGLGSGEIILWPYLVSNYGLGIIWGAVLGITFQFFINLEIERYSIVRGESIFVGFARFFRFLPVWFILSTFIGFGWPGIIASSAKIFGYLLAIEKFQYLAILFLLIIGIILTLGPVLYKTVERFQKTIILIGIPTLIVITVAIATKEDYLTLTKGFVGIGEGYNFLPEGISFLTLLGAFAFSGAGGNLNLAQSFYVKEKGFGMGKYAHKIKSIFSANTNSASLEGTTFVTDSHNLSNFKRWWKLITIEHSLVFLITGILSISLLALLSYSTTYLKGNNFQSIDFIINESKNIGAFLFPQASIVFLILTGTMLFATQFAVLDSTSRIISENLILANVQGTSKISLAKAYYFTLWAQILFGIVIFLLGFRDPRSLITLSAVLNAFAMFIHIGLTYLLNVKTLPSQVRPSIAKKMAIVAIFIFFGGFSLYSIWAHYFT